MPDAGRPERYRQDHRHRHGRPHGERDEQIYLRGARLVLHAEEAERHPQLGCGQDQGHDETNQEAHRPHAHLERTQAPLFQTIGGPANEQEDGGAPDQAGDVHEKGEEERRLPVARVASDRLRVGELGPDGISDDGSDLGRELRTLLPGGRGELLAGRPGDPADDGSEGVFDQDRGRRPDRRAGQQLDAGRLRSGRLPRGRNTGRWTGKARQTLRVVLRDHYGSVELAALESFQGCIAVRDPVPLYEARGWRIGGGDSPRHLLAELGGLAVYLRALVFDHQRDGYSRGLAMLEICSE